VPIEDAAENQLAERTPKRGEGLHDRDADAARTFLADQFEAQIVDMESAAAAQVAILNGIPFLAVRAVSDYAGGDALAQITDGAEDSARAAARAVIELIERIP